jgi:hypothetical protein
MWEALLQSTITIRGRFSIIVNMLIWGKKWQGLELQFTTILSMAIYKEPIGGTYAIYFRPIYDIHVRPKFQGISPQFIWP